MADWQTILILVGAFAGVELLGAGISLATGGQVDIHNIAYDCSPERLVCPNTGFINGTRVQCNIFGCYREPLPVQFTGYFTYDYAQKWDWDYGSSYVPIISEITAYEATQHICLLNLNIVGDNDEMLQIDSIVEVNTSVGGLSHTFVFKPYSYQLPTDTEIPGGVEDMDARVSFGVYRFGCYTNKNAIGNNSVMYTGIIEDRTKCEAVGQKKLVHALEAEAWFPEGRYQCKRLDFWFFPMLLTFLIGLPMIFAYYQAMGITQFTRY